MTIKLNPDVDILKIYLQTINKVAKSSHYVTNFESLLAFTIGHIPTKLHQFLISSFRDFVHTDRRTDKRCQKQYLLAECAQVIKLCIEEHKSRAAAAKRHS